MASANEVITTAYEGLVGEVPSLGRLRLVTRLELRGRGDVQVYGVSSPGPAIGKGEPDDARVEVAINRSDFNELAEAGDLERWADAVEHGKIKLGGDPAVLKLLGTVIAKHRSRSQFRRVR
jgi:hypothetical protein